MKRTVNSRNARDDQPNAKQNVSRLAEQSGAPAAILGASQNNLQTSERDGTGATLYTFEIGALFPASSTRYKKGTLLRYGQWAE